jgi:hypothetical protein
MLQQAVIKPEDIERAFSQVRRGRRHRRNRRLRFLSSPVELVDIAARRRIATVFNFRELVEAGELISYGPNVQDMCSQSARLIRNAVNGEPTGEIPMELPTRIAT